MASVLRAYGGAVRAELPWPQRRLVDALTRCRTAALGGHRVECACCGHMEVQYNSCRDRHCPTCAAWRTRRWLRERQARMLPVPHFQVVFTLPDAIRPLARAAPRLVYGLLMSVAASAMRDALETRYQARFAITAVLHTWTRQLLLHPHVHLMVSAGGLKLDGTAWVPTGEDFLISSRRIEPLFRARVLAGIRRARDRGELDLHEPLASRIESLLQAAAKQRWVIHVEAPKTRGPEQILRYLGRYMYRVAIDDRRIVADDGTAVTIRTRGKATVTLPGATFVRRFAQHALPRGFRKVRYYGLLAPGALRALLPRAFELLGAVPVQPEREEAPDPTVDPLDDREPRERCHRCGERALFRWVIAPSRGPPGLKGAA